MTSERKSSGRGPGRRTVLSAALVLLVACTSTPILVEPPIQPPPGLSVAQVEKAIRAGMYRASQGSTGAWVVEKSNPGVIVTGIRIRQKHYLQVTFRYTASSITSTITGSEGLDQDGDSINKRANVWHTRLDEFVRQELFNNTPPR